MKVREVQPEKPKSFPYAMLVCGVVYRWVQNGLLVLKANGALVALTGDDAGHVWIDSYFDSGYGRGSEFTKVDAELVVKL